MSSQRLAAGFALALSLAGGAAPGRGQSRPPDMRADLEKTALRVDVLAVELRFDPATKERIEAIATGPGDARAKEEAIADAAFDAEEVVASLRFKRRVRLYRFVDAVRDDLEKAERAGMIDPRRRALVAASLPRWFAAVEERGFRSGDLILYRGDGDSLHTRLVTADGDVLVDQVDRGEEHTRVLLAGYFAPGATFRAPLVKSVLE